MALLHLHSDVIDLLLSVGAEMTDVDVKMYMQFEVRTQLCASQCRSD